MPKETDFYWFVGKNIIGVESAHTFNKHTFDWRIEQIGVSAIASVEAKLQRVMPKELSRKIQMLAQTVSLALRGSRGVLPSGNDLVYQLAQAISEQKQCSIDYTAADGNSSLRKLNPYHLAYFKGYWYLVGFCQMRKALRSFRLDRIANWTILDTTFTCSCVFNPIEHLQNSIGDIVRQFSVEIVLRTDLQSAQQYIERDLGLLVQEGRYTRLYNQTDDLGWLARCIASWPFEVEIIKPEALKQAVGLVVKRLLSAINHTDQSD